MRLYGDEYRWEITIVKYGIAGECNTHVFVYTSPSELAIDFEETIVCIQNCGFIIVTSL